MSNRLYKRFVEVALIKPSVTFGAWFQPVPNALIIRDLRVQFKIEKQLGKEPNKADIVVTNLAPATRTEFEKKPLIIRLQIGYDGSQNLQHLFSGDVRIAATERNGNDWDTKFQMADGDRAYQFAHVSRSFSGATRVLDAVKECTDAIGLPLPPGIESAREMQAQFAGGVTLHGPAHAELTHLLTPAGMSWSIQDGKLQILRPNDAVKPNTAIVISQDTGMVGSPAYGDPKKLGGSPVLKVKCLCKPEIFAGVIIAVQSRSINGQFRVDKVTHTGDTRAKDWFTELEAKPL